jgi:hypothetical protein
MNTRTIDRLFERMAATYGPDWVRSMGATPLLDVKASWAHYLSGYQHRLEAIGWALDHLPERPPNVIAFRNLCQQAPSPTPVALPEPKADPARMAAELAKLGALRQALPGTDPANGKAWAYALKAKQAAGGKLTAFQNNAWRVALRVPA